AKNKKEKKKKCVPAHVRNIFLNPKYILLRSKEYNETHNKTG
ncbi:MAG: hypothetical protein RJA52_1042, partial [Bacteroidota bacterium]